MVGDEDATPQCSTGYAELRTAHRVISMIEQGPRLGRRNATGGGVTSSDRAGLK